MRRTLLGVMLLVAMSASTVSTAANQVAPSTAASATRTMDANTLKPEECADLDLSAVVTTGTGTDANELILGTGSGETLIGGGGNNCIVAGAGDDILVGGPGFDVCIGGPGRNTYENCDVQVATPPGVPFPPTALNAAATSPTSIVLSWTDNADNEDGFAIERSPAGSGSWEQIATTAADATTHTDSGLAAGAAYDYRVRAFNAVAYSAYSNVATASTVSCASPGTTTVFADADTYVFQAEPNTNAGTANNLAVMSSAGANIRTLVGFPLPAIPTGCEITAATLRLESTFATPDRTLEALRVAGSWTETEATWNDQPATAGPAATTPSAEGWVAWSVTEQVSAMHAGENHGFLIRDSAEGAASFELQAFTSQEGAAAAEEPERAPHLVITYGEPPPPPEPPSAPSGLAATGVSGSRIDLSWTDTATNEDGFTIERSPAGQDAWAEIATTGADVTTHADTGLATDSTYDYRVRAFNAGGTSAWSNTASATTGSCAIPGTTIKTDRDVFVAQAAPTTNFHDPPFDEFLAVQSRDGNRNARTLVGFPLPALPEGCALTGAALRLNANQAAPGRTLAVQRAAATWTETDVTWNTQPAPTGATSTTASGPGWVAWDVRTHVAAMYTANHGFVIRDAAEGAGTDQIQVFASREGDATLAAELILTYGELPEPPSAPSELTATAVSGSQIDLAWTGNATNEDGFTIERSPAGQDTWAEIATTDADTTTHADTGLPTSTTYDYRVRAFNTSGTSAWSDTATATTTAGCLSPGTQTVIADRDVFVAQANPTTNFQNPTSQGALEVQSRNSNRNARALVGFALPAVPTGCTVTEATLRLNAGSAAAGRTLLAHQAAATWTETGVTWDTQPATAGPAATTTSGVGWRAWAVTSQVTAMYTGANHGFVIRDSVENAGGGGQTQVFSSREGANPPQLVITFG